MWKHCKHSEDAKGNDHQDHFGKQVMLLDFSPFIIWVESFSLGVALQDNIWAMSTYKMTKYSDVYPPMCVSCSWSSMFWACVHRNAPVSHSEAPREAVPGTRSQWAIIRGPSPALTQNIFWGQAKTLNVKNYQRLKIMLDSINKGQTHTGIYA